MSEQGDDDIPTLSEMIFPGNPEKSARKAPAPNVTSNRQERAGSATAARDNVASSARPAATAGGRSPQKQSNFEALISARIDHILEKHMEAAREEIVRVVMLELRARLPNTQRKDK